MDKLRVQGAYTVDNATRETIQKIFWSDYADDQETAVMIQATYQKYGYVMDTHTGVGRSVYTKYRQVTGDHTKTVLVSTASPFKFNASVAGAILGSDVIKGKTEFELLETLTATTGLPIPRGLRNLEQQPIRHTRTVAREDMKQTVIELLL
jgi:threonine synthase